MLLNPDLLLSSPTAKTIFAAISDLPVYDIHTHVDLPMVLDNKPAPDPWTALCAGDHYVSSIIESLGFMDRETFFDPATDPFDKWKAYAEAFPWLIGNQIRDWMRITLIQLGVARPFNPESARSIWDDLSKALQQPQWRPVALFEESGMRVVSTTNHPTDSLKEHVAAKDAFRDVQWIPTWRPDFLFNLRPNIFAKKQWQDWMQDLEKSTSESIFGDWPAFLRALQSRHDFFGERGCRGSDYGMTVPYGHYVTEERGREIFEKASRGDNISEAEAADFQALMLRISMAMDYEKGWFSQLHFGVARNQRDLAGRLGGLDSGCDTINSSPALVESLHDLLNYFDKGRGKRHRILLYSSARCDWEKIAGLSRIFPAVHAGMSWWYFDSVSGMLEFFRTMPDLGAGFRKIGPFVTDARNIYSLQPRTQVYRRCLSMALADMADLRRDPLAEVVELARYLCAEHAAAFLKP